MFPAAEYFVSVAAAMTAFIATHCSSHYLQIFLGQVVTLMRENWARRGDEDDLLADGQKVKTLSPKLT
jgi:uncharacterized radical SAM superfamily protein